MGLAFGILALGGTEPEIHLGVIYPPNCNVRFKKYHCNTRVKQITVTMIFTNNNSIDFCHRITLRIKRFINKGEDVPSSKCISESSVFIDLTGVVFYPSFMF